MKLAKEEGLSFPSVETVMLTGQLFSPKYRQEVSKYFDSNLWVSSFLYMVSVKLPKEDMDE